MKQKPSRVKKGIIALLNKSKKRFYDPDTGEQISTNEFVDKLLTVDIKEAKSELQKIKKKKNGVTP